MLADCLKGTRVLDLSQYLPGPYATMLLADLGAEVIKIEPPAGDPFRAFPPQDGDGIAFIYKQVNRGKTVVRLDLKREEDRRLLEGLVAKSDVLLESYRPGVLARLGFAPERLKALNPRLIHCALSGFGQTGPDRGKAGHDLSYLAMTGNVAASGVAERPAISFPPMADHAAAWIAVIAILGALLKRGGGGKGAFIDTSLYDAGLSWQYAYLALGARPEGAPRRGGDMLNGGAAYYNIYRCADGGFVALGAIEEKFWASFCDAVGRAEWKARQHEPFPQEALIADLAALFATRPRDAWAALLDPADCCFQAVFDHREALDHPHLAARGLVSRANGFVETLFPALLDGKPPAPPQPFAEMPAAAVLKRWS